MTIVEEMAQAIETLRAKFEAQEVQQQQQQQLTQQLQRAGEVEQEVVWFTVTSKVLRM